MHRVLVIEASGAKYSMVAREHDRLRLSNIEDLSGLGSSRSVGEMLRQARFDAGLSVEDVACGLRIRRVHIEAMEEGRLDELPGRPYALGFVRTYAKYLGLDADAALQKFKAEFGDLDERPEFVFPAPAPEGRVPGGAIMFVSVALALVAYGGWYYLTSNDKTVADIVPDVPAHLSALLFSEDEPTRLADADGAAPAATGPVTKGLPGGVAGTPAGVSKSGPMLAAPGVPIRSAPRKAAMSADDQPTRPEGADRADSPAGEPSTPQAAIAGEAMTPQPAPAGGRVPSLPPLPAPPPPVRSASGDAPAVRVAARTDQAADVAPGRDGSADAIPAPPAETEEAADRPARPGRIVIRATRESWVQVRDQNRAPLMTGILRPGEEYLVPDRGGLTLLTGNAGGLDILIDGEQAPALGPLGAIRRNVALDAQLLRTGAAAN